MTIRPHFDCIIILLALCFAGSHVVTQSFEPDTDESKTQLVIDGFTEPYRDIRIGSPDTAAITEIRVDEGDSVRYGQVIAKLDDVLVRATMNIAREASLSTGELETANLQVQTNVTSTNRSLIFRSEVMRLIKKFGMQRRCSTSRCLARKPTKSRPAVDDWSLFKPKLTSKR